MRPCLLFLSSVLFFLTAQSAYQPAQLISLISDNCDVKNTSDWIAQLNALLYDHQAMAPDNHSLPSALAHHFPSLDLPYLALCTLPTPVYKMETLSALLNSNVYVKRDDHSSAVFGGNKPRKLEFELAHALRHHASHIITFGCAGSNHAVATSSFAKKYDLLCECMLLPQPISYGVRHNILRMYENGANLHYAHSPAVRKIATFALWLELVNNGQRPYIIPTGASSPLGCVGYVNAAYELKAQIEAQEMPEPDAIYLACGSMGTTAGLLLGCKAAGIRSRIVAVAVQPEEQPGEFKKNIINLFGQTNQLLKAHSHDEFPLFELQPDDFDVITNYAGNYGLFTAEGMQAREMVKKTENIVLDGTYTAKAMAALLADIHAGKWVGKSVLFWNTYCGIDASKTISNDYKKLPFCFHYLFEEEVQELDKQYAI